MTAERRRVTIQGQHVHRRVNPARIESALECLVALFRAEVGLRGRARLRGGLHPDLPGLPGMRS